jgi:hypothetical protein
VLVCAGRWDVIEHPGHYESRPRHVWIPGHWRFVNVVARIP